MKSHSENKGYLCKYCGKYFKPVTVLEQHIATMHTFIKAPNEVVVTEDDKVETVGVRDLL